MILKTKDKRLTLKREYNSYCNILNNKITTRVHGNNFLTATRQKTRKSASLVMIKRVLTTIQISTVAITIAITTITLITITIVTPSTAQRKRTRIMAAPLNYLMKSLQLRLIKRSIRSTKIRRRSLRGNCLHLSLLQTVRAK